MEQLIADDLMDQMLEEIEEPPLKINVSFKKKEKELYDFIKLQRSPGGYMKDAVEFYRKYNGVKLVIDEKPMVAQTGAVENKGIEENDLNELLFFN